MIDILSVEYAMSGNTILKNINLSLKERRIGIIGSNGSGKSTLIKLIKGLITPSVGKIFFQGNDLHSKGKVFKNKIGYVFQDPDNQIIMPLVEEDIAFGLKRSGLSKLEIQAKVLEILRVYQLEKLIGKTTYHLSGGEKQLIAIAGVLAMHPEIVIFDEPTTLLDLRNKYRVQMLIQELHQPVIVITHDLSLIKNFDRVIVLEDGEVVQDNIPEVAISFYVDTISQKI